MPRPIQGRGFFVPSRITARPIGTCGKFRSLFRLYYRAPLRDLRDVQVVISTFAHTGPRAEKAVCRRDAGKPTPRRRVGRLVCAAKTRARKAERPPTYCRPSGQGLRGKSPCPPLRVALPGEPLAAGGTGGTNPRPRLCAGGAASVCRGLCFYALPIGLVFLIEDNCLLVSWLYWHIYHYRAN